MEISGPEKNAVSLCKEIGNTEIGYHELHIYVTIILSVMTSSQITSNSTVCSTAYLANDKEYTEGETHWLTADYGHTQRTSNMENVSEWQ